MLPGNEMTASSDVQISPIPFRCKKSKIYPYTNKKYPHAIAYVTFYMSSECSIWFGILLFLLSLLIQWTWDMNVSMNCKLENWMFATKYYTVVPLRLSFMPVLDLYVIFIFVWVFLRYFDFCLSFLLYDLTCTFLDTWCFRIIFVNMLSIAHPNPH